MDEILNIHDSLLKKLLIDKYALLLSEGKIESINKDIFNKICAFILKVLYMNSKLWYNVFTDFVRINF